MTAEIGAERQKRSASRLPPVGFWSYARQDDELSDGRLTRLRALLMQELQQQYGREQIRLFQDAAAIPHGSDWEQEIKKALEASTFFIPIITPNFVQSEWCCREVELFFERERTLTERYPDLREKGRIFPILFIGIDDVDPESPDVLAALQKLQWFDFRRFRHRSFDEAEVREAISELAANMRALLRARVSAPPRTMVPPPPPAEPTVVVPSPPAPRPAPPRPIETGDLLNHMFEVKRFIKAGGMGQVFEGANVMTSERVAIKALLPALGDDPKIVALFQREAMTLTRLNHEALVQYRALAKEPERGLLYIVTEYIDGPDLSERLDGTGLGEDELRRLLARLASGLAVAHRLGAIHRDISPDNVMLPGGDIHEAKIIDFGIAKDLGGALPTLIGDGFAGKLNYVAPEQLGEHGGEIGPWTDVYSLALVILAVAQGEKVDMSGAFADAIRKRHEGPDLSGTPAGLRPLLADMLALDPAARIRSMTEVIARLKAPPPAPPLTTTPPPAAPVAEAKAAPAPGPDTTAKTVYAPSAPAQDPETEPKRPKPELWLGLAAAAMAILLLLIFLLGRGSDEASPKAQAPAPPPPVANTQVPVGDPPPPADPQAWLYGRWGPERNCSSVMVISGERGRLRTEYYGEVRDWQVREVSAQQLVTERARYTRAGAEIRMVEQTADGPFETMLKRCP